MPLTWTLYDENDHQLLKIYYSGKYVRIETDFGLVIQYDGFFSQSIAVPNEASGNIDGLCRNFNNDLLDEKILPDSTNLTGDPESDSKLAAYYQENVGDG